MTAVQNDDFLNSYRLHEVTGAFQSTKETGGSSAGE